MGLLPEPPALSSDARTRLPEERPRELLSLVASLLGAPARAPSSSMQAPYSSSRRSKSGPASVLGKCGSKREGWFWRSPGGARAGGGVEDACGTSSEQLQREAHLLSLSPLLPSPPLSPLLPSPPRSYLSRYWSRVERGGSHRGEVLTRAGCSGRRCL